MLELDSVVHRYGDSDSGSEGDGSESDDDSSQPDNAVAAVDDVSLTISDGEFLVLCGPNGSGKTTLVRHLNTLVTADEGSVLVDGVEAAENPVVARTTVGMTFQDPRDQFVATTVASDVAFGPENLGLSHAEIDRRVDEALAAVGLEERGDDRVETLSGGEQERLAIAGALAMEPEFLVLDEPFTGLDAPARESVLAHLQDLNAEGTGLIVVTHDLRELLDPADRVICLANGQVVVDAEPEVAVDELESYGVRVPDR